MASGDSHAIGNVAGLVITAGVGGGAGAGAKTAVEAAEVGVEAASGTDVLFGQASVARTFTAAEKGSTFEFAGQSIKDVAAGLRSGAISPNQIPVRVVELEGFEGQLIAVNNRSLTAFARAGMRPTNIINLSGDASVEGKVLGRISEMGGAPSRTIRIRGVGPNASAIF